MTRFILRSLCLAVGIFAAASPVLAVWPPSTSLVVESEASSEGAQSEGLPAPHQNVQTIASKIQQDERRLANVIQNLKDDEAALKKLSRERSAVQGDH
jgi:hypothetical protein